MIPFRERPLALRLIIVYKLVKAPLMLALALYLTLAPHEALALAFHLVRNLSEAGAFFHRVAFWLNAHLSAHVVRGAEVVAWLDGVSTAAEGFLLLSGKPWGEWLVVLGLAALLPLEAFSLNHRPSAGKAVALVINAAIVVYLAWRRLKHRPVRSSPDSIA